MMNKIRRQNLEFLKKKYPDLDAGVLASRVSNISWSVRNRARVCEVMVNSACNYRCLFCYNPADFFEKKQEGMSFEEICRALYKGRKEGCWIACLIGGEPTLKPDLARIASFARRVGYPCVKVCTNGFKLAQKDYVRHLAEHGVNMFDISLHGVNAEIHDRLAGHKGAFRMVIKAMENVKSIGMEVGTNQVVNRLNFETFPEFFEMAVKKIGINYFNIIYSHYRGIMASNSNLLKVPVSKTAPYIKRGLDIFIREKLPAFCRIIVNFAPCILPGYRHILADWQLSGEQKDEPLFLVDGRRVPMGGMKDRQNVKPASCKKCVFFDKCRGIDREYVVLFGDREYKPLLKKPGLVPIRIVYS